MALAFSTLETREAVTPDEVTCRDFQAFQLQLKKLRFVDDRIVNELNSEISRDANPVAKCQSIHDLIVSSHEIRGAMVNVMWIVVWLLSSHREEEVWKTENELRVKEGEGELRAEGFRWR